MTHLAPFAMVATFWAATYFLAGPAGLAIMASVSLTGELAFLLFATRHDRQRFDLRRLFGERVRHS